MPTITIETKTHTVDIPDKLETIEDCEKAHSDLFDMIALLKLDYNNYEKMIRNEIGKINNIYNALNEQPIPEPKKVTKKTVVKKTVKKVKKKKNEDSSS